MGSSAKSKIASSLLSALRFYRVADWLHFLGFTFLGILLARQLGALDLTRTMMILGASAALLAYAYSFNDVFDHQIEIPSSNRQPQANGRKARSVVASLCPLALGIILLAQFSSTALFLGVLFSLLWAAYSYPMPRLRAIPVICTIVNGVGFPILFLIGLQSENVDPLGSAFFFSMLVFLEIPAQLVHEICHSQGDRVRGFRTTAVHYGARKALQAAILSLIAGIILVAILLAQGFMSPMAALSLGSFAIVFTIVLAFEQRLPGANFSELRMKYRYGGIIAGVIVAVSSLLGI
jgi:4-hydroxybenzoate polyprenyltransferase